MNLYPDYSQIIYRYINNKLIGKVYQGEELTYKFIETYSQNLPIKFKSLFFNYLLNYKIYGTSAGAGVETENLFDGEWQVGYWALSDGQHRDSTHWVCSLNKFPCVAGSAYSFKYFDNSRYYSVGWYDSNDTYISMDSEQNSDDTEYRTFTAVAPNNAAYMAISIGSYPGEYDLIDPSTAATLMLVKGSTPPATYIPYGYKLPLTVESGVTENVLINDPYKTSYYINENGQETAQGGFNIYATETLDTSIGEYSFYFAEYGVNTTVRVHGYSNGVWQQQITTFANIHSATITKPEGINEIRISCANGYTGRTLVKGSTPPDHYIPHRYTSDIPIYIGNSKLGEEEYVDYEEQKVYKRTENDFPFAKKGIFAFGDNANIISDGEGKFVISAPSAIPSATRSELIPLNKPYMIPQSVDTGGEFVFYLGNNISESRLLLLFYDADGVQIENWLCEPQWRVSTAYSQMTGKTIAYVSFYALNSLTGNVELTPMFSKNTNLTSYIPYLQPIDPPVPLPPIPTYKNENTLSTNISLGEVTIKGRIESITPPESIVYGYHINPNESDPSACITYIEDAIGKNPASMGTTTFDYGDWQDAFFMPRPCMVKYDGTVDYYLNPNDYTKKEDGSDSDVSNINYQGNAMMQWPKIYWKYESGQTEGEGYFYVSNIQVDNSYKCWCNINSKNNEIDYFYTAIYNGTSAPNYDNTATYNIGDYVTYTDTTYINGALYQCNTAITTAEEFDSTKWTLINASSPLRSLSGIQTNQANGCGYLSGTIQENRALANNTTTDTEWYFDVLSDRMLINGLLILMGKSLNTQAVFGNGITSGGEASKNAYVTGSLNDKGLFYGDISGTTTAIKVFGMENWWGHTWHRTAGLIGGTNNTYLYKLTHNNYDGSTSTSYNSTGTGYLTAISNNTATNIIRPSNSVDDTTVYWYNKAAYGKWGYLPIQVGGSSTTYYADYYYNGTGYLLVGGDSNYGAGAGASCFNLHSSFASAAWYFGPCLSLKPLALGART